MESIIKTTNGTVCLAIKYGATDKYDAVVDTTKMFGAGNEPTSTDDPRISMVEQYALAHQDNNPGELVNFSNSAVVSRGENLIDFEQYLKTWQIPYEKNGYSYTFSSLGPSANASASPIRFSDEPIDVILGAVITPPDTSKKPRIGVCYVDQEGTVSNRIPVYATTQNNRKIASGVNALYLDWSSATETTVANPFVYKNTQGTVFKPYKVPILCDTSAIVQKYFPDGMKSAGAVHDEIDWERMVAIQRVGSAVYDGVNTRVHYCDNNCTKIDMKYNYAYMPESIFNSKLLLLKPNGKSVSTIGTASSMGKGYENGGVHITSVISLFIPNVAVEGNTKDEYIKAFNNVLQANPVTVNYELAEPIETPITEPFDPSIEVESGGTLTFENDQGADFHVPVPNQETFMIKLPGGAT